MFCVILATMLCTTMYTAMILMTHVIVIRLAAWHEMTLMLYTIPLAIFGAAVLVFISLREYRQQYTKICRMKLEIKLCNSDTPPPYTSLSV